MKIVSAIVMALGLAVLVLAFEFFREAVVQKEMELLGRGVACFVIGFPLTWGGLKLRAVL